MGLSLPISFVWCNQKEKIDECRFVIGAYRPRKGGKAGKDSKAAIRRSEGARSTGRRSLVQAFSRHGPRSKEFRDRTAPASTPVARCPKESVGLLDEGQGASEASHFVPSTTGGGRSTLAGDVRPRAGKEKDF